jgi:hypothetical protein
MRACRTYLLVVGRGGSGRGHGGRGAVDRDGELVAVGLDGDADDDAGEPVGEEEAGFAVEALSGGEA